MAAHAERGGGEDRKKTARSENDQECESFALFLGERVRI